MPGMGQGMMGGGMQQDVTGSDNAGQTPAGHGAHGAPARQ